jgi:PASTA domain
VTTNNKSAVTFTAAKTVVTKCVVTKVVNVPLGTAKKLLTTHGCKVGKVTKTSSGKVAKGDVIKTTPGTAPTPAGCRSRSSSPAAPNPRSTRPARSSRLEKTTIYARFSSRPLLG